MENMSVSNRSSYANVNRTDGMAAVTALPSVAMVMRENALADFYLAAMHQKLKLTDRMADSDAYFSTVKGRTLYSQDNIPMTGCVVLQTSGFFKLPLELRQLIYDYYGGFVCDRPLTIRPKMAEFYCTRCKIFHICKLIREETLPVFYQKNIFGIMMGHGFDRGRFHRFIHMLETVLILGDDRQKVTFEMGRTGSNVKVVGVRTVETTGKGRKRFVKVALDDVLMGLDIWAMEMAESSEYSRLSGKAWLRIFDDVAIRLDMRW